MSLTFTNIEEIITGGKLESFIGETENEWFDCKSQPYGLDKESAKMEIAKDVSSFANRDGGFILIGFKTEQEESHLGDTVTEIRAVPNEQINITQYYSVLESWIYPKVANLNISLVEHGENKGILVIKIPKQEPKSLPFLITKTINDSKKMSHILFGYVERRRDNSQSTSVVELHEYLKNGLNYREILEGLSISFQELSLTKSTTTKIENEQKKIESRIENTLAFEDIKSTRTMTVTIYPEDASVLKSITSTDQNSIRSKLEKPPTLRYGGWDLGTLDRARIVEGKFIRVGNGDRKVIDLYRDGTLIFACQANESFLAHASNGKPKLNPVALIEVTYSVFSFYKLVLEDFDTIPNSLTIRVDFRNMFLNGEKSYLVPYGANSHSQLFESEKHLAPKDVGDLSMTIPTANFRPEVVAYNIIKEIYLWFGIEEEKIPYKKDVSGIFEIDTENIGKI